MLLPTCISKRSLFAGFDAPELYKHIAGMNAVRLRHALRFAFHQHRPVAGAEAEPPRFADLVQELRVFKAKTSSSFEMPTVTFGQIGGYDTVKEELKRAVEIVGGAAELPDNLRHDLVPRGFIFHGPPGTGKTLFAKAVANAMDATIQVVSGPEITDMYVGESERKVRELVTGKLRGWWRRTRTRVGRGLRTLGHLTEECLESTPHHRFLGAHGVG